MGEPSLQSSCAQIQGAANGLGDGYMYVQGGMVVVPGSCKQALCDGRTADDALMLVTLTYKDRSTQQEIYVNEGLTRNLLVLPAITELQIIARLDAVSDVRSTIMESYPKLFTGLGNFGNPHEINLKKDAVPFALNTPRRIPLALRDQVKAELQRMENLASSDFTCRRSNRVVRGYGGGSLRQF